MYRTYLKYIDIEYPHDSIKQSHCLVNSFPKVIPCQCSDILMNMALCKVKILNKFVALIEYKIYVMPHVTNLLICVEHDT